MMPDNAEVGISDSAATNPDFMKFSIPIERLLFERLQSEVRFQTTLKESGCFLLIGDNDALEMAKLINKASPHSQVTVVEQDLEKAARLSKLVPEGANIKIVEGKFPSAEVLQSIGEEFDLIIAKHVLPFVESNQRADFVKAVVGERGLLKENGMFVATSILGSKQVLEDAAQVFGGYKLEDMEGPDWLPSEMPDFVKKSAVLIMEKASR